MAATRLDEWDESAWFRQWLDLARKINDGEVEQTDESDSLPEGGDGSEDQDYRTFIPPSEEERAMLWLTPVGGASRTAWGADISLIRGNFSPHAARVSGETIFMRPK